MGIFIHIKNKQLTSLVNLPNYHQHSLQKYCQWWHQKQTNGQASICHLRTVNVYL